MLPSLSALPFLRPLYEKRQFQFKCLIIQASEQVCIIPGPLEMPQRITATVHAIISTISKMSSVKRAICVTSAGSSNNARVAVITLQLLPH